MKRTLGLLGLGLAVLLAACQPATPPSPTNAITPAVSAPAPAPPVPVASAPSAAPTPRAHLQPIMFAGHRAPQNAAWTKGGFVITTHDELWRVTVKNELSVPDGEALAAAWSRRALGATGSSLVVGVGLDDGSVDVFRGPTRLRTIPPKPADGGPLQLSVSASGHSIAVTRSNGTWPERTTVYDVETGAEQAQVEGGNVLFDATGAS